MASCVLLVRRKEQNEVCMRMKLIWFALLVKKKKVILRSPIKLHTVSYVEVSLSTTHRAPLWSTADALKIPTAENSQLSKFSFFKPGIGQNMALRASLTARKSTFLICCSLLFCYPHQQLFFFSFFFLFSFASTFLVCSASWFSQSSPNIKYFVSSAVN